MSRRPGRSSPGCAGSGNVAASAKKAAGIKGDIGSRDALDYLRGVLEIVKAAGYKGLRHRHRRGRDHPAHAHGLAAQVAQRHPADRRRGGLLSRACSGSSPARRTSSTPGTASPGSPPLHDRIRFLKQGRFASLRQAQLELAPFDAERLRRRAAAARALPDRGPRRASTQKISIDVHRAAGRRGHRRASRATSAWCRASSCASSSTSWTWSRSTRTTTRCPSTASTPRS